MSDSFLAFVVVVGVAWLLIGLVLALVMGRRGHSRFSWLVVGTLLGPLAVVMAIDSRRYDESLSPAAVTGAHAPPGTGPVDVLAGYDGSAESRAAIQAVTGLLGERLGRLTVATVVPFDGGMEVERMARSELERVPAASGGGSPSVCNLEVLHGRPAEALQRWAEAEGYELIAVGCRGAGMTKRILGSAASDLARGGKVPVLVVGAG